MPSAFSVLWDASAGVFDEAFGEQFIIKPRMRQADVNARRVVDPDRPDTIFIGVWRDDAMESYPQSPGHASNASIGLYGNMPKLDYATASLPFRATAGDIILRVASNARFEVADPGDDGFTRTTLTLTASRAA